MVPTKFLGSSSTETAFEGTPNSVLAVLGHVDDTAAALLADFCLNDSKLENCFWLLAGAASPEDCDVCLGSTVTVRTINSLACLLDAVALSAAPQLRCVPLLAAAGWTIDQVAALPVSRLLLLPPPAPGAQGEAPEPKVLRVDRNSAALADRLEALRPAGLPAWERCTVGPAGRAASVPAPASTVLQTTASPPAHCAEHVTSEDGGTSGSSTSGEAGGGIRGVGLPAGPAAHDADHPGGVGAAGLNQGAASDAPPSATAETAEAAVAEHGAAAAGPSPPSLPDAGSHAPAAAGAATAPSGRSDHYVTLVDGSPAAPSAALRFHRVAVGGTFDRLHAGHELLLAATALVADGFVFVGVTADALLANKSHKELLQPYDKRVREAVSYIRAVRPSLQIEAGPLSDPKAPTLAELDPSMEALVVSMETMGGAAAINAGRVSRGFRPLTVVTVPVIGLRRGSGAGQGGAAAPAGLAMTGKLSSSGLRALEAERAVKAGHAVDGEGDGDGPQGV